MKWTADPMVSSIDLELAKDGTFHVPHQDGIYRGQVNAILFDPDNVNNAFRRVDV